MEFSRILVPVAGTEADEDTLALACRLAGKGKTTILGVHVIPVERSLPLDAEVATAISGAEDVLAQAQRTVAKFGCKLETELLQARQVGPAIVDQAVEHRADLIIIGLGYKTRFGEFCLGCVAPYVMQNAPCPVLVFQQHNPETVV